MNIYMYKYVYLYKFLNISYIKSADIFLLAINLKSPSYYINFADF